MSGWNRQTPNFVPGFFIFALWLKPVWPYGNNSKKLCENRKSPPVWKIAVLKDGKCPKINNGFASVNQKKRIILPLLFSLSWFFLLLYSRILVICYVVAGVEIRWLTHFASKVESLSDLPEFFRIFAGKHMVGLLLNWIRLISDFFPLPSHLCHRS